MPVVTQTYLNYPFDQELFMQAWAAEPDPIKLAMLNSGMLVHDERIAAELRNDGNYYTIPFYKTLTGNPVNLDGQTDIPDSETTAGYQSGIAYFRGYGWTARDFVAELSGADPMGHIVSSVARFWQKEYQDRIIGLLGAIFGITGDTAWAKHSIDLSVASGTPYVIEANTLNNAATATLGDNKGEYAVAIMHADVALTLENLQLFDFWKQTDANGIQRPMKIASINGYTVIIDNSVPVDTSIPGFPKYTTYLLGRGVLRTAPARVDHPIGVMRDEAKNGGQETMYTRVRETIHPNGFSFKIPTTGTWTNSPTDAQLFNKANWERKFDAKAIPMARIITNG